MLNIRRARADESEVLTNVTIKSEAYWGYDSDYMEKFKSIYKVTEEFINNNPTFIMEKDDNIVGFYSRLIGKDETSLEYFFIAPQFIGKGYGKSLWNHMVAVHFRFFRMGIAGKLANFVEELESNINKVVVCTGKENLPAVSLYLKNGYQKTKDIEVSKDIYLTEFEKIL